MKFKTLAQRNAERMNSPLSFKGEALPISDAPNNVRTVPMTAPKSYIPWTENKDFKAQEAELNKKTSELSRYSKYFERAEELSKRSPILRQAQMKALNSQYGISDEESFNRFVGEYAALISDTERLTKKYNLAAENEATRYKLWQSSLRPYAEVQSDIDALDKEISDLEIQRTKNVTADSPFKSPMLKQSVPVTEEGKKTDSEIASKLEDAKKRRESLQQEKKDSQNYYYTNLTKKTDFSEKSKWDEKMDLFTVNRNKTTVDQGRDPEFYATDEEAAIYRYLKNTKGEDAAEEYSDYMRDTWNQRKAGKLVETTEAMPAVFEQLAKATQSLSAGVERYGQGVYSTITGKTTNTTAQQFAKQTYREKSNAIGKAIYDLSESIGNMAPGILLSAVTGNPTAGLVSIGVSSGGNAYNEARKNGASKADAYAYGTLVGMSEAILGKALGGISSLGGGKIGTAVAAKLNAADKAFLAVAGKLAANGISEGVEEGLQTILEPIFATMVLDEKYKPAQFSDVAYSALLGFLSAGFLEGGNTTTEYFNAPLDQKVIDKYISDGEKAAENSLERAIADDIKAKLTANPNAKLTGFDVGRIARYYKDTRKAEKKANKELKKTLIETAEKETTSPAPAEAPATPQPEEQFAEFEEATPANDNTPDVTPEPVANKPATPSEPIAKTTPTVSRDGIEIKPETDPEIQARVASAKDELERTGILSGASDTTISTVRRLSKLLKTDIRFEITPHIKGADGISYNVNGRYNRDEGVIYVNMGSDRSTYTQIISHEFTHSVSGTDLYNQLERYAKRFYDKKAGEGAFNAKAETILSQYKAAGKSYDIARAKEEVVANYVADELLNNEANIERLVRENRSLAEKLKDVIDKVMSVLGDADAKTRAKLARANKLLEKALNERDSRTKGRSDIRTRYNELRRKIQNEEISEEDYEAELSELDNEASAIGVDLMNIAAETMHDVVFSLSFNKEIEKAQREYISSHKTNVTPEELAEAQRVTSAMVDVMIEHSEILPEDKVGKVLTKNGSYDISVENTTICVRTLAYNQFIDLVQEKIGRPLSQMESFLVSQKMYDIAQDPQCLYCYVSLDRKAFNDMLLRYMSDRDTVIMKYNNSDKSKESVDQQYQEFLNGRKDTDDMKGRFNTWLSYADNGTKLLSLADIATNKSQSAIANGSDASLKAQLTDARKYAQRASWAKIQKNYVAYRDEILKLKDNVIKNLNEHYGMRWYSFSDFSPAFIVENMQQITDASIRGLKGLSYTKDTAFAEVFAPSGMNINISVFVTRDKNGNFVIDEKQSADFEEAKRLRALHKNIGIVATVTDDEALRWAGEQEWSDVIIPFHIVRTGTDVAEYYKWLNYTDESGDKIADKDLWDAYVDSLNPKTENARKKVSKNIYPNEHNNNKDTYLNLCESRGLTPRFARFSGEPWYMKLVNETRLSAQESTPLKPKYDYDAAERSFNQFITKGGYEGGWYMEGTDVDAEADVVASDVLLGKKANEVDYGRQDGFVPEDILAKRKSIRRHSDDANSYSITPEKAAEESIDKSTFEVSIVTRLPVQSLGKLRAVEKGLRKVIGDIYKIKYSRVDELKPAIRKLTEKYLSEGKITAEDIAEFTDFIKTTFGIESTKEDTNRVRYQLNEAIIEDLKYIRDFFKQLEKDANAQPEWVQESREERAKRFSNKKIREFRSWVREEFSIPESERETLDALIANVVARIENGTVPKSVIDSLFGAAFNSAEVTEDSLKRDFPDVYRALRRDKLTLTESEKSDLAGYDSYKEFREDAQGYLNLGKDGTSVEDMYAFCHELAPSLFPIYIDNTNDQAVRLLEVSKMFTPKKRWAFEKMTQEEREKLYDELTKQVLDLARDVTTSQKYAQGTSTVEQESEVESNDVDVEELLDVMEKMKKERRKMLSARGRTILSEKDEGALRAILDGHITVDQLSDEYNKKDIKAIYEASKEYTRLKNIVDEQRRQISERRYDMARKYLADGDILTGFRDRNHGLLYMLNPMERNLRYVGKRSQLSEDLIDAFIKPIKRANRNAILYKNSIVQKIEDLELSRKVKTGDGFSEAYAVQFVGEAENNIKYLKKLNDNRATKDGHTLEEWQTMLDNFWKVNPGIDRNKINNAVDVFREIYDDLFKKMNESRVRNGYEPISYRRGYFPHFSPKESNDILAQFGKSLGITVEFSGLPTDINGLTQNFRPGMRYQAFANERLGFETVFDAVEGLHRYLDTAADVIYQTDNICNLRALSQQIRYQASDEGKRKREDFIRLRTDLDETERAAVLDKIHEGGKYTLSNFVNDLEEYTNLLAGKKSKWDRGAEALFGRSLYGLMKNVSGRIAANMVAWNVGSWLTNFIPLVQGATGLDTKYMLVGMKEAMRNLYEADGFESQSVWLTTRRGSEELLKRYELTNIPTSKLGKALDKEALHKIGRALDKSAEIGMIPMEAIDMFVSNTLVRGRYHQNIGKGMTEEAALEEADSWVAGIMADRSKGGLPTIFGATNPMVKLLTQFQVEVANQIGFFFSDLPIQLRDKEAKAIVLAIAKYVIGAYLYNTLYEALTGRRPALDPLGMINDSVGNFTGKKLRDPVSAIAALAKGKSFLDDAYKLPLGEAMWEFTIELAEEVPFVGGLLGGGRIPISSALPSVPNIIKSVGKEGALRKVGKELLKPATYSVLPGGGGQISKAVKGISALAQGGKYGTDTKGREILQYPITPNPWTATQSVLFGPTATKGGKDWIDSNFKSSLSYVETKAYKEAVYEGMTQDDAYDLIDTISSAGDKNSQKIAALNDAKVPRSVKRAVYEQMFLSESPTKAATLNALDEVGAYRDVVIDFMLEHPEVSSQEKLMAIFGDKIKAGRIVENSSSFTKKEKAAILQAVLPNTKSNPYWPELKESVYYVVHPDVKLEDEEKKRNKK